MPVCHSHVFIVFALLRSPLASRLADTQDKPSRALQEQLDIAKKNFEGKRVFLIGSPMRH